MKAPSSVDYAIGEPMPGTKWVVRGTLGQGGMGIVLDVEKERLIRGAMKVLLPPFAKVPEFAARFLAEVKVTARLQHPSIVQVLDFDRLADGTPFMVMERLRGRTLRAALRETRQRGTLWTAANTYAVAAQTAEGLYRAHSLEPSIVHRDVKPENIFLHRRGASSDVVVKVMDFGVAAVVGERDRQSIGTPRYMAPEQVEGGELSPQTDQYALALVVYEMLTGRLPWDVNVQDRKALAEAHRHAPPTPASRFCRWLPPRMDAALLKALSKDPRARHDTLHGLMFELRGLQWIDRSGMTGDANTTDPGALAEGGAAPRDESEPVERAAPPHAKEPPVAAAGSTSGSALTELSDSWEPPTWPLPERGSLAKQASMAVALESRTTSDSLTTVVRAEVSEDHAPGALPALDTPMTGASGADPEPPIRSKGALGTSALAMAVALAGGGAVAVLLVSARIARVPREPATRSEQVIDSQGSGAASAASDLELGARPPRSITEAVNMPGPPADSVAMPVLAAPAEADAVKTTSVPPDAATNALAARKATALPRPLQSPPTKAAPIPDDGRDELYVPAGTR
jgi:eukaryotic-like serine/threonine-protein kinase